MKLVSLLILALALFAFTTLCTANARAQITLSSTVPAAQKLVLIQPHKQAAATGVVKFKFSAPT